MGLSMMRKPPAEAKVVQPSISVETIVVSPEDVPVEVTGLGEVRALNVVPLSPEVPGIIVSLHPRLEMGEIIPEGDLLFSIDPRDYQAASDQAASQVAQLKKTIERLERQYAIDQGRLKTLERNEALMQKEFERTRDLFEKDDVGTRSNVDHAEMNRNQAADARDQLAQAVSLYPVQIQEARSALEGAEAQLSLAQANLARTEVRAPFDARIKDVKLEQGQYVTPGAPVVTLADDRMLEISVSLDSRDARQWLLFEDEVAPGSAAWFGALKPVRCRVAWTEDPEHHYWEGQVHRIEAFDQQNRTVNVAIRISSEAARESAGGLPLVEGMFCSVAIPGRTMESVYRLPRWAVTYEGETYVVRDGRLAIQSVEVVRSEGQETFIGSGLSPGTEVITTRLVNPLPNTLVNSAPAGQGDA
jgi:RND family efflux transporter MFP subunit